MDGIRKKQVIGNKVGRWCKDYLKCITDTDVVGFSSVFKNYIVEIRDNIDIVFTKYALGYRYISLQAVCTIYIQNAIMLYGGYILSRSVVEWI